VKEKSVEKVNVVGKGKVGTREWKKRR